MPTLIGDGLRNIIKHRVFFVHTAQTPCVVLCHPCAVVFVSLLPMKPRAATCGPETIAVVVVVGEVLIEEVEVGAVGVVVVGEIEVGVWLCLGL